MMTFMMHDWHMDAYAGRAVRDAESWSVSQFFSRMREAHRRRQVRRAERAFIAANLEALARDTAVDPQVLTEDRAEPSRRG